MSEADRNRLAACRACGNRVPRAARRCPACGAREPASAEAAGAASPERPARAVAPAPGRRSPTRRPRRRPRRAVIVALAGVIVLAAAAEVAVVLWPPPTAPPLERRPASPAESGAGPDGPLGAAAVSRSRGRADWLFFFKPGDWLGRMTNDAPLGVVVRVERAHTFADGSVGPAYVIRSTDGEERTMDADELERSARIQ